jgi:hypothetical protein
MFAVSGGCSRLKEFAVGIYLQIQQVGDGERNFDFSELFGKLTHEIPQIGKELRPLQIQKNTQIPAKSRRGGNQP